MKDHVAALAEYKDYLVQPRHRPACEIRWPCAETILPWEDVINKRLTKIASLPYLADVDFLEERKAKVMPMPHIHASMTLKSQGTLSMTGEHPVRDMFYD